MTLNYKRNLFKVSVHKREVNESYFQAIFYMKAYKGFWNKNFSVSRSIITEHFWYLGFIIFHSHLTENYKFTTWDGLRWQYCYIHVVSTGNFGSTKYIRRPTENTQVTYSVPKNGLCLEVPSKQQRARSFWSTVRLKWARKYKFL